MQEGEEEVRTTTGDPLVSEVLEAVETRVPEEVTITELLEPQILAVAAEVLVKIQEVPLMAEMAEKE